jgi:hypothetical protein
MHSRTKILFGVFLILGIIFSPRLSAAIGELGLQDSDVEVTTTPSNPEPYQSVTISLVSYATDLNKAFIEWQSGSNLVLSGTGRTSYSFKALGPNTNTLFTVTITPGDGGTKITKQIIISPSDIEILWEGVNSYVPPFYKGKTFPSTEGLIRATAIPNTSKVKNSKSNMVYTWKNNGKTVLNASGYGKDSYLFTNSELNNVEKITVTASSVDGSYNATKTINIPILNPKVIFYKKSPTEGILYNSALQDEVFIEEDEMTVVAAPYFLALRGNENKFSYDWQINGKKIDTPSKKTELTIRPSSRGGYATISVVMENFSTFFQKVTGQLKLNL